MVKDLELPPTTHDVQHCIIYTQYLVRNKLQNLKKTWDYYLSHLKGGSQKKNKMEIDESKQVRAQCHLICINNLMRTC